MKFSIIVAVYNIEGYIDQCLDSLVSQSYKNFEIILVDDGSMDSSSAKLDDWARRDSRIRVIHKKNGGLSSARNAGLELVTGDYVLFVDGDDWLDVNILQKIEVFIKENRNVDILCFSYVYYYNSLLQVVESFEIDSSVLCGKDFFERSKFRLQAWNKAYRVSFLNEIGLQFLEGKLHEDISFTIPLCMCAQRVASISEIGYYYRQNREGSIMATVKERNVHDFANAVAFAYKYLNERCVCSEAFLNWIANAFVSSCFSFKTTYRILKRNMISVGAPAIMDEISYKSTSGRTKRMAKYFFFNLWIQHIVLRFRYLVGRIIHYKRYHAVKD
ncbi:glycosyltransferase [Fibrobacter sp.]|uniref:glycosyltransferase n=1 Tax=Fibrobacter sp. TaxID=35828 RepID=UPI00386536A0